MHRKAQAVAEIMRGRRHGLPHTRVAAGCKVVRIGGGIIQAAPGTRIARGVRIAVISDGLSSPTLKLGRGVSIGDDTRINVAEGVTIGDHSEISWLVQILDTDFHQISDVDGATRPVRAPVTIGHHVLIGTQVLVLKGVRIGDGAVIGAGSVVTGDIPAGVLAAGNPARPIRDISGWK